ncbi:MAG: hypothetical protein JXA90_00175, partial [Planctomycetes bacterium]|nr:hypothetical protein [Planctomycetota bacterium]
MRRFFTHRILLCILYGVALTTAVVCGIGIHLTISQHRDMQGILLETERRSAENQMRRILPLLAARQETALDALVDAGTDPRRIEAILRVHPFLGVPFFIGRDGALWAPLGGGAPPERDIAAEGAMPAEFEGALRLSWTRTGEAERRSALEEILRSEELEALWRLRARLHVAASHLRDGTPTEAIAVYERTYEEFQECLLTSALPSLLHLSLAHAEAAGRSRGG